MLEYDYSRYDIISKRKYSPNWIWVNISYTGPTQTLWPCEGKEKHHTTSPILRSLMYAIVAGTRLQRSEEDKLPPKQWRWRRWRRSLNHAYRWLYPSSFWCKDCRWSWFWRFRAIWRRRWMVQFPGICPFWGICRHRGMCRFPSAICLPCGICQFRGMFRCWWWMCWVCVTYHWLGEISWQRLIWIGRAMASHLRSCSDVCRVTWTWSATRYSLECKSDDYFTAKTLVANDSEMWSPLIMNTISQSNTCNELWVVNTS